MLHLVGLLDEVGQDSSQLQQLTRTVPRVEVQVEVCQPAEVGKGLSRSRTQTVSGEIQGLQAHQTSETKTARKLCATEWIWILSLVKKRTEDVLTYISPDDQSSCLTDPDSP